MNELARKMEQDMVVRNYSPKTVARYMWHINAFDTHIEKPLDQVCQDDIRSYLYYLKTTKQYSRSNLHQAFSAIKYLYRRTMDMPLELNELKGPKRGRSLPQVLSIDEVGTLLSNVGHLKHHLILMTLYSAGLRLNECTHLRVTDIDSKRMTIRVRQGKGNKDRYTLLSVALLEKLRFYWQFDKPAHWLFPSRNHDKPITGSSVQKAFHRARERAGIRKKVSVHSLRHSFATHLLEQGVNLFTIKELLGHTSIHTTLIYLHLQHKNKQSIVNPLDQLFRGLK